MSDAIATALISGLCVGIPSVITVITMNRKSNGLMEYRLNELEHKMDKHNDVMKRTFILEAQIKVVNQRINDLERKGERK